ncbi:Trk system potassium transporter TrkA [Oceanicella actignis]|uniref:Trk system potassium uptake protein TrkA n=1 Tax=Oceanicella actignis TaxID=1189325 RepID=A0A1M7RVE0_9RHOB|nr:Trk system potassium transporter TrkA [Oceanicella actignis]SET02357.1 trk system potassium uptake protein TrkA [Oceanicella actignis]SHN50106.1 trk system potassium uptake protein TrkA [Oceanicella actignis]
MKIIICGAGQVGSQIARHLAGERNDVTIVDQDPGLVRRVTEAYDVSGVTGFASHPDVLERAGAADAEMLIAATFSDEVNMVACQIAHSVFSVSQKIARIRAQSYLAPEWSDLFRRDHMPIDVVISPELEVARVAMRRLLEPEAFDSADFLDGHARLVGLRLDENCPLLNTPLRQLTELFSTLRAIVAAYRRDGRLHVAEPEDQLYAGDEIYFVAAAEDVRRAIGLFGREAPRAGRVTVIGAGSVGLSVARMIENDPSHLRVKMIERDRARAERAAETLERTIVLMGDGLDPELQAEAGVGEGAAVLALTDDDKTNLLAAARGKRAGCATAIALSNDASYSELAEPLGIDAMIVPRATTVSSILRHVRRGRVRQVYSVGDQEAEAIEAVVLSTSPIAGKPLRAAGIPSGAIVCAVMGRDGLRMPRGDLVIEEGDRVLVFALSERLREVEQLFRVSAEYF